MKQIMLFAVAGLLVFGPAAFADGGKRKTGSKQECPASCTKKQCDKKACVRMGCTPASCSKKS